MARMSAVEMIEGIQKTRCSIPVMAKVRIGHVIEAAGARGHGGRLHRRERGADPGRRRAPHRQARVQASPFVCGARNLGEALRRIGEGAAMIRTKGEAGSGNIVEAVRHLRTVNGEMRAIQAMRPEELMAVARRTWARPYDLVRYVHEHGKLPVPNFAAGGVATPPTRRSAASSVPRPSSSARASSRATIPSPRAPGRSCAPAPTGRIRTRCSTACRGLGKAMDGIEMSDPRRERAPRRSAAGSRGERRRLTRRVGILAIQGDGRGARGVRSTASGPRLVRRCCASEDLDAVSTR